MILLHSEAQPGGCTHVAVCLILLPIGKHKAAACEIAVVTLIRCDFEHVSGTEEMT